MLKSISAAAIVIASLNAGVGRADDLSSAAALQSTIARHQQAKVNSEAASEAMRDEAQLISKDILFAFFQQARKAGIKFDVVYVPRKSDSGGVVTTTEIVQSSYDGRFVYDRQCAMLSCTNYPEIQPSGLASTTLYIIFDGPKGEFGTCEDAPNESCMCRFSESHIPVFSCADVFNRGKRSQITSTVVAALNKNLVADLKQKAADK